METGSATITVSRAEGDPFEHRPIEVSVDGERWVSLRQGRTATRPIPPGAHSIRAHNTLFRKTLSFEARAGEHVRFLVANRPGLGTSFFLVTLGTPWFYVTLERVPETPPATR